MNAKHTPGPWVALYRNAAYWDVYKPREPDSQHPIEQYRVATVLSNGYKSLDEHSANARLIAAAPDLLDVLLRANDAIEALDGTTRENEKLVDDYRAAIAKAGVVA